MKKKLLLLLSCMLLAVLPLNICFAESLSPVSASIIVDVKATGAPAEQSYTFTLTPQTNTEPMPSGSADGKKTITVTSQGTFEFGTIQYEKVGIYQYTVQQITPPTSNLTPDNTIYHVTVTVIREGEKLKAIIKANANDTPAKASEIVYNNTYTQNTPSQSTSGQNPAQNNATSTSGTVDTGSNFNPILFVIVMFIGAGGVFILSITKKKEK